MYKTMQMPHVLLLYPKTGFDYGSTVAPPHSLLAVAAPVLKAGYSVKLFDQRTQTINEDILSRFISNDLICVGISSMTGTQIRNALQFSKLIRKLTDGKVPVVWGGPHPSIIPEQTVMNENVDVVVIGEGEDSFLELVRAIESKNKLSDVKSVMYKNGEKNVKTEERALLDIEDLLPVPWQLIDVEKYIHRDMYIKECSRVLDLGQTSRGCPYQCGFCCSATIRKSVLTLVTLHI